MRGKTAEVYGKRGGAMAKQTKYQEHVRAAREWLGRAEDSLAQEDHIRGDLDVMLAQAELQRATEVGEGHARRRWLRRLLPAGAAALVAALVWGAWPSAPPLDERPPAMTESVPRASENVVKPVASVPMMREASAPPPMAAGEPRGEEALPLEGAGIEEMAMEEAPSPSPSVRVPSRDMQKLMRAAGQSLRAQ